MIILHFGLGTTTTTFAVSNKYVQKVELSTNRPQLKL
jgi:hypothetical protein